jgi:hypothetical protein
MMNVGQLSKADDGDEAVFFPSATTAFWTSCGA